ncbi:hypothetical protein C5E45_28320 [Nocardia nova]|uniref:Uncharacterized protein n=1 Tax=Nocardia nova TaxID=37330 RepID=A0A2S6AI66_9NOCA|nr:helix-turn-helix transcriptional regulator [Nocardia nova]PPJ24154.1 hypothetical protein C5E41_22910 [Nocardia nova]PPJ34924.1 hypothetical protein C5E45_28320 [Nocardia nova]
MDQKTQTLAAVVGENAKRIRGGLRLEDISEAAREYGLKWDTSRVSALERGEVSPNLTTLLALSMALSYVTQAPIGLTDLVAHEGDIRITPKVVLPAEYVAAAVSGEPADQRGSELESSVLAAAIRQAGGLAEQRAAQSLGITGGRFASLCLELWGHAFVAERDRRAGPDANAQRRGQVTREMKAELRQALSHGDN